MTPRTLTTTTDATTADLAYLRHLLEVAAEFASDGRPSVGVDLLLAALRAAHGPDGRADIAPEMLRQPRRKLESGGTA